VKSALTRYAKSTVFMDPDSETWKKLKASLEEARADIACWEASDGLAKSLLDLKGELTDLRNWIATAGFADQTPALAVAAAKLLKPLRLR